VKDKRLELSEKCPDFEDKNTYEKFSGSPKLWERLKRYCKAAGVRPSHFVQAAILEKLNREDYEN